MRLIDANALIKKLYYSDYSTNEEKDMCCFVRRMIKEQPTAFDKEKVIEELKKAECSRSLEATSYRQKAIEIVERGGVDEVN